MDEKTFREDVGLRGDLREILASQAFQLAKQVVIQEFQPSYGIVACPHTAAASYSILSGVNKAFKQLEELATPVPENNKEDEPYAYIEEQHQKYYNNKLEN